MLTAGLVAVALLVLTLPLLVRKIEEQLELFLLAMGALAVTVSSRWGAGLVREALTEPLKIAAAVLAAGFLFRFLSAPLGRAVEGLVRRHGLPLLVFLLVVLTGLASSVITAIIAAIVLVELVGHLGLKGRARTRVVVTACFSIGLGAALTPIGEPLSTLVVSKLSGEPYHAGFFFLAGSLWYFVIPAILGLGGLGAVWVRGGTDRAPGPDAVPIPPSPAGGDESLRAILLRTLKVYVFVAGLVLLGSGLKPLIDMYVSHLPLQALFWINSVSAFLDNATLAAAEIGPSLGRGQITAALLGLLTAGGMLIPGNIPNIISAGKLKIRGREWAAVGVPVGLVLMTVYFALILALY